MQQIRLVPVEDMPDGHRWAVASVDDEVWLLVRKEKVEQTKLDVPALNEALARAC